MHFFYVSSHYQHLLFLGFKWPCRQSDLTATRFFHTVVAMASPNGAQSAPGIGTSERDGSPAQTNQADEVATGVAPKVPLAFEITDDPAINVYYRCGGITRDTLIDGQQQATVCGGVISADAWPQKITIQSEIGSPQQGQRWYCYCGKRYQPRHGVLVEMVYAKGKIGYLGGQPCAFYFQAVHPTIDIAKMQTLFTKQQLKKQGCDHFTPDNVQSKFPTVELFALGSVLMKYVPGDVEWQGHWYLATHLVWDSLPRWSWDEFYSQFDLDPNYRRTINKNE